MLACLLAAVMLMGTASGLAEETTADNNMVTVTSYPRVEDAIGRQAGTEIVIGTTTPMSGYFATELWGYNTSDMDVRALLHGYATVAWTRTLGLTIDGTAVAQVQTTIGENGNRIYTFELMRDLQYSDGTVITAKDYVFSLLLCGAPEIREIGGTPQGMDHVVGYAAYQAGEAEEISGVRLLTEYSFSMEIDAGYLPFFYGLGMLNVTPYPPGVIIPGCDIVDDGQGAYIASVEAEAFGAEMLERTLLDPETGYVFNPRVTSGPYALETFDAEANEATFVINEYYLGNYEGKLPHIERVRVRYVSNETMLDELASGGLNIVNKATNRAVIDRGIQMETEGALRYNAYLRTGFAYLSFACEEGATSRVAVRQAVAHCLDVRRFTTERIGAAYGLPVFGYYGLGQWIYNQRFDANAENGLPEVDTNAFVETLEKGYDLSAAKALLTEDGWTLNERGEAYEEGTDRVRYRRDEAGELEALMIRWAKSENSGVADWLAEELSGPFAEVGIGLEITEMPFAQMQKHYYRQGGREYNMFFLSNNFNYIFDPYYDFNTAEVYQGMINTTGLVDEELMERAWALRETLPQEIHAYAVKWMAFQERFAEMMPMVPLYSSIYYDFFGNDVQGYNAAQYSGWAFALPYTYFGEAPAEEDLGLVEVSFDEDAEAGGDLPEIDVVPNEAGGGQ